VTVDEKEAAMPRSRYRFVGDDAPYFMTMTVNHWLPVFLHRPTDHRPTR
jgi:hypothetical protein